MKGIEFGTRPGPGAKVAFYRLGSVWAYVLPVGTTPPYLAPRFGTQDLFPRDPTIFVYQIEPALEDVEPESKQKINLNERNVPVPPSTHATHAISLSKSAMMAKWKPSSQ
jgi:hypothetical protein